MSKQTEDIIMKAAMEFFGGDAVKFFGIDERVVAPARTEFNHIEPLRKISDWIWETDKDSYLHFEFQSDYDKKDLPRFMLSDAMIFAQTGKPVRTIVVYSAEITETITSLDAGAIKYNVEAFYMSALDGDKAYADIKAKVEAGEKLTKQDLMSIVFLPMMKNSTDKYTRFEQTIALSKEIPEAAGQVPIQAMIYLLSEKFIKDPEKLEKLKEMMGMTKIGEMLINDGFNEGLYKKAVEIAMNMLREGLTLELISKTTGLDEEIVLKLQEELVAA